MNYLQPIVLFTGVIGIILWNFFMIPNPFQADPTLSKETWNSLKFKKKSLMSLPLFFKFTGSASYILGIVSFPSTIIPVIGSVVTLRNHNFISDELTTIWTTVIAILSIHTAVQSIHISTLIALDKPKLITLFKRIVALEQLWTLFLILLFLMMKSPSKTITWICFFYTFLHGFVVLLMTFSVKKQNNQMKQSMRSSKPHTPYHKGLQR